MFGPQTSFSDIVRFAVSVYPVRDLARAKFYPAVPSTSTIRTDCGTARPGASVNNATVFTDVSTRLREALFEC